MRREKQNFVIMCMLVTSLVPFTALTQVEYPSSLLPFVTNGDSTSVVALLKKGADANIRNEYGLTALMRAAQMGLSEIASLLIDKGVDINATTRKTNEIKNVDRREYQAKIFELIQSAASGDINYVSFHIESSKIPPQSRIIYVKGKTALMFAVEGGHAKVASYLISKGADANAKDNHGQTALNYAASNGHIEIASLLVDSGVFLDNKDNMGWTPLLESIFKRHSGVALRLIEKGADVNIKYKDGITALMLAAYFGQNEVVTRLVDRGADLSAVQTNSKKTALMGAAQEGHFYIVSQLLAHGAKVNAEDKFGRTALFDATKNGRTKIVSLLLEKGANPNVKLKGGWTALMFASRDGYIDLVELLIKNGADMNAMLTHDNLINWDAITLASYNGHTKIVSLLLENGAKVNNIAYKQAKNNEIKNLLLNAVQQKRH
jgi:serine/threonine-protein phosphatase 6 regulatory ankyrin repeat subunit B